METRYYIAGRLIMADIYEAPRRGDEIELDGRTYRAARVVRHCPGCPPDFTTVHLELVEPELTWPPIAV